jgi:hypothetical protein
MGDKYGTNIYIERKGMETSSTNYKIIHHLTHSKQPPNGQMTLRVSSAFWLPKSTPAAADQAGSEVATGAESVT